MNMDAMPIAALVMGAAFAGIVIGITGMVLYLALKAVLNFTFPTDPAE